MIDVSSLDLCNHYLHTVSTRERHGSLAEEKTIMIVRCFDKDYNPCKNFGSKGKCVKKLLKKHMKYEGLSEIWCISKEITRRYKTEHLYRIIKTIQKIESNIPPFQGVKCNLCKLHAKNRENKIYGLLELAFTDIPEVYKKFLEEEAVISRIKVSKDHPCKACLEQYNKFLSNSLHTFDSLGLDFSLGRDEFYSEVLGSIVIESVVEVTEKTRLLTNEISAREVDSYKVGSFTVKIYEGRRSLKIYNPYQEIDSELIDFVDEVVKEERHSDSIKADISSVKSPSELHIYHSEEIESSIINALQKKNVIIPLDKKDLIKQMVFQDLFGWGKYLHPLLLDDKISEIRIVGGDKIRISHRIHGKCVVPLILSDKDIEIFISSFERESRGKFVGSSKQDSIYIEGYGLLRVFIKKPPSVSKPFITIRKHREDDFTLAELCVLGTFSPEQLAFLIARNNLPQSHIIYIGNVSSGKTTAESTIDRYLPQEYDVEVVCDINEIRSRLPGWNINYVKRSEEGPEDLKTYEEEIPDMLRVDADKTIIAEILTPVVAKSFFHILVMGKKGSATSHASNLREFFIRLKENFGISKDEISSLDIVVTMRKIGVRRICESIDQVNSPITNEEILSSTRISYYDYNAKRHVMDDFYTEKTLDAIRTSPLGSKKWFEFYNLLLKKILEELESRLKNNNLLYSEDFIKTYRKFELDLIKHVWDDVISLIESGYEGKDLSPLKEYLHKIESFFEAYR